MGESDWGWKLGLVLMGGAMFSKPLIQFSVDGLCSFPVVWPEARLLTHTSTRDSRTLTGKSSLASRGDTAPHIVMYAVRVGL